MVGAGRGRFAGGCGSYNGTSLVVAAGPGSLSLQGGRGGEEWREEAGVAG